MMKYQKKSVIDLDESSSSSSGSSFSEAENQESPNENEKNVQVIDEIIRSTSEVKLD